MSQEKLIDPNKEENKKAPSILVKKQKKDIIERKEQRTFTEDGKEILT